MIPYSITRMQADIAYIYWGIDWTYLSASEVQEALDWWYREEERW